MRILLREPPFDDPAERNVYNFRGAWPASWVACAKTGEPPFVTAYRKAFSLQEAAELRIHVSADERYELFLDGQRIGRGPERGNRNNWFYESYELPLAKGEHVLVARVWSLGGMAPVAQMTVYPGFFLAAEAPFTELLSTGMAAWEARKLNGYDFVLRRFSRFVGARFVLDGQKLDWDVESDKAGAGWSPVVVRDPGIHAHKANGHPLAHLMRPAMLPGMIEQRRTVGTTRVVADVPGEPSAIPVSESASIAAEQKQWNALLGDGGSVAIPAHTRRRVLIDLNNYYCAYPVLRTSGGGGSSVRIAFAEALFGAPPPEEWHWPLPKGKGNRGEIEGKFFVGTADTFRIDGGRGRKWEVLWWQAGRYIEVYVETADEALTIDELSLMETRYPLEMESTFSASDERLGKVLTPTLRVMQMCAHETYMDCPYYEQLMYVGDTRTEVLTTYCLTHDERLPRKALWMFNQSRIGSGLTQSRYPSHILQLIPPFSLFWVCMLHDYAMWRNDPAYVRGLLPGARAIIDSLLPYLNEQGLLRAPHGWNFCDWVPRWAESGTPAEAEFGFNGQMNWLLVMTLGRLAELERQAGEEELATRWQRLSRRIAAAAQAFWDPGRRLFSDDLAHKYFSEHSQCLAILSGALDQQQIEAIRPGLMKDPDLERTTIYFTHYLFETYRQLGEIDAFFSRMGLWFDLEKNGFRTTPELPEPARSDCHTSGAHPIYHFFATLLGIRPASFGFASVAIQPQLGPLRRISGTLPHPRGEIRAELAHDGERITGRIALPEGVDGVFVFGGKTVKLRPGIQRIG